MYRALFEAFGRDCVQRIARGESLNDDAARAFSLLLDAKERSGHRLLGRMAGPDPSIDTVTGRCGHPPARQWIARARD
jgi:hypothetical protein